MNIEEAKKELLEIKKDNESKAMIINNNSSNMQIRWSNKDLKEMAEISQRCAREIRAIETVLAELEKKDKKLHSLEWDLRNIKRDLDFEPWSIYQVKGDILFDMAQQVENKVEREGK